MKMKQVRILLIAMMAVSLSVIAAIAFADDYPSKPINYVIPFGPGGESDITARHQQPFFKEMFGEDLVISYKPGGGGAVGGGIVDGDRPEEGRIQDEIQRLESAGPPEGDSGP